MGVVVVTRDRRDELLATLGRLTALPEAPPVVVVDNASGDGTSAAVASAFPEVALLRPAVNRGAVGRTLGLRALATPYVAFADDDSWWEPGALRRAADVFDAAPALGLLQAAIEEGPDRVLHPACAKAARAPLGSDPTLPGPSVLGHVACGVVVRRSAYLQAGGYSPVLGFGGEERLLSLDLAAAGWQQCYVAAVVARHAPSPVRELWADRWARYRHNDALTAWLRQPLGDAVRATGGLLGDAAREPAARPELGRFARRLPAAFAGRRPVPTPVVADLRRALAPAHPALGAAAR